MFLKTYIEYVQRLLLGTNKMQNESVNKIVKSYTDEEKLNGPLQKASKWTKRSPIPIMNLNFFRQSMGMSISFQRLAVRG